MTKLKRRLVLLTLSTALSLALLEAGLRMFTSFPLENSWKHRTPDPILDFRMKQGLKGIDANGFRNAKVLDHADIIAIGDSHTYGMNVWPKNSWPGQLSRMTGMSVYNFGIANYGIFQYYHLMQDAFAMQPKHIIIGLFPSNDLNDMCYTLRMSYWRKFCVDKGLINAGAQKCIEQKRIPRFLGRFAILSVIRHVIVEPLRTELLFLSAPPPPKGKAASAEAGGVKDETIVINDKLNSIVIDANRIRRVYSYTDLSSERILGMLDIAKALFKDMKQTAERNGVRLCVLIIPSPELMAHDYQLGRGYELGLFYRKMAENEKALIAEFSKYFDEIGLEHADAYPLIAQAMTEKGNVYPPIANTHPIERGYEAYAQTCLENFFPELKKTGTPVAEE